MSTSQVGSNDASAARVDHKLEVLTIPVSDVERAKEFYLRVGWRLDVTPPTVVQFTPLGSECSVQFGADLTSAPPGSAQRTFLVVTDIDAALAGLAAAGIAVDDVYHLGAQGRADGVDPEHHSYLSYASFRDPDANSWLLQEVTTRLPGRVDATTTSFGSPSDLANAMRRASVAHGEHEKRIGAPDADWPDWYARYMVAEQAGTELPT